MEDSTTLSIQPVGKLDIPFVTIDADSSRDIDDALHVARSGGGYRVRVAIANPTKLVTIGSTEDAQARLIGATAYMRDTIVRRMLPGVISEFEGSLVAGKARAALVFDVHLSNDLEVTEFSGQLAFIKVAHRLSYTEIPVIVKDSAHQAQEMLAVATALGLLLLQARRSRGALALYDLSRMLLTDEEGNVRVLHSVEEVIGQILVQEMMILVNHLAARYLAENNIPCIMRNHEPRVAAPPVASDLATTIEGWIAGGAFDAEIVRAQFSALAGKASYGAVAKGHFGLSLPFYTHISSPLRRYADLVNMRQFVAHLRKKRLPYTQSDLVEIAEDINNAVERRKEERSEGFKATVQRTAERAMERGMLAKLADHELRQAVKLSRNAGYLPQQLTEEISDRLQRAVISDSLADTLMTEVPHDLLTEDLRSSLAGWLAEQPPKAMHMLAHAQQTGFIVEVDSRPGDSGAGGGFSASFKVTCADGRIVEANGRGDRKRDAEQAAAVAVICQIMSLPHSTIVAAEEPVAGVNFKGRLHEWCQKRGWPAPTFESSGKGPSHAMIFSATATLVKGDRTYQATAGGASGKKEAEMLASRDLLEQLQNQAVETVSPRGLAPSNNPVGELQEYAQRYRKPLPIYEVSEISKTPSSFRCSVFFDFGTPLTLEGQGATKQAAKSQAAAAGLLALRKITR